MTIGVAIDPDARRRAAVAGRHAGSNEQPIRNCPYDPEGPPEERVLARVFTSAYLRAAPPESGSVRYDDDGEDE